MNDISNIINEIIDNVCEQCILRDTIIEIEEECYICRDEIDSPLIDSPCVCNMKIHEKCFLEYLGRLGNVCSVCRSEFNIPFNLMIRNIQNQIYNFNYKRFLNNVILSGLILYFCAYLLLNDYITIDIYWLIGCIFFASICANRNPNSNNFEQ